MIVFKKLAKLGLTLAGATALVLLFGLLPKKHEAIANDTKPSVCELARAFPENEIVAKAAATLGASKGINLAVPTTFKQYDTQEAFAWAADIVFSPERAKSREVIFAYRLNELHRPELKQILAQIRGGETNLALLNEVNKSVGRKSENSEVAFFATPISVEPEKASHLLNLIDSSSFDDDKKYSVLCAISGVTTLSSLRASGIINVDYSQVLKNELLKAESEAVENYVGLTKPISTSARTLRLMADRGNWTSN